MQYPILHTSHVFFHLIFTKVLCTVGFHIIFILHTRELRLRNAKYNNLSEVTQWVGNWAKIHTQEVWPQSSFFSNTPDLLRLLWASDDTTDTEAFSVYKVLFKIIEYDIEECVGLEQDSLNNPDK